MNAQPPKKEERQLLNRNRGTREGQVEAGGHRTEEATAHRETEKETGIAEEREIEI